MMGNIFCDALCLTGSQMRDDVELTYISWLQHLSSCEVEFLNQLSIENDGSQGGNFTHVK